MGPFRLLVTCLLGVSVLAGQEATVAREAAGAEAAAPPAVAFPMERTAYVLGEQVPLAVGDHGDQPTRKIEAVDQAGQRILLYSGTASALVLDTAGLAAGRYALQVDGRDSGAALWLVDPVARSGAALTDESLPSGPQLPREVRSDPTARARATDRWFRQTVRTLRETGINVALDMGAAEKPRDERLDAMTAGGALVMVNPYTRPMSFMPARLYGPELEGMRQRMALIAQANGRYPAFGGFCFTWDPTGFTVNRKGLFVYWQWGKQEGPLRTYLARSQKALEDEFRRRTGLEPVAVDEYLTYLLSIKRPEFAPAIDLPSYRWIEAMARHLKPLEGEALAKLQERVDAWAGFLMGLYEETHADFMKHLGQVDPSLVYTAAVNVDHCAVRDGQYTPSAYRGLPVRYVGAWNDQIAGPDYAYQWLFSAAMLDVGRRGEPVWVGHSLGQVHGQSAYPGKFVRATAHDLAHGGSGGGFALEGFSTVLGGMNRQTHWDKARGTVLGDAVVSGRDFLDRFAFLALAGRSDGGVAILYSRTQMARQNVVQVMGSPQYRALVALTRLGYTPRFVTEGEIAAGGLAGYEALVVVDQTFPLPVPVVRAIGRFQSGGSPVLVDGNTTIALPGARPLGVTIPFGVLGRPFNWSSPNVPQGAPHVALVDAWYEHDAPPMLAALGGRGRAAFVPTAGARSDVTVAQIHGGDGVTYLVAVNDSSILTHTDWYQVRESLEAGADLPEGTMVCDLTEEKTLGKVRRLQCDLSQTTARVYALLARPVEKIALAASQEVEAGGRLNVRVEMLGPDGRPLRAALPFHLALLRPDGTTALACYRSTDRNGRFDLERRLSDGAPPGPWRVAVRSQFDGQTAELPVSVRAPKRPPRQPAVPLAGVVVVRDRAGLKEFLRAKDRPVVIPLFEGPHFDRLLSVAERVRGVLASRGIRAEILRKPAVGTYWLAYDPTPEQLAENARIDRGQQIGRIKLTTVNRNDYYSAMGGYRVGLAVVLLDLAGAKDNPMVERLDQSGLLWPAVSAAFPGKGGAVLQCVRQAFGPNSPALVIQAVDPQGLEAAAGCLVNPPQDWLVPSVAEARRKLLAGVHAVARRPMARRGDLTSRGLRESRRAEPFRIRFGDARPPRREEVRGPEPRQFPVAKVPGAVGWEHYVPQMRDAEGRYLEAWTPGKQWKTDLRFVDAIRIPIDVAKAGRTKITAAGRFRFSDRRPCPQGSWEELLALYAKIVPARRLPMQVEVWVDGKPAGKLDALTTARREVPLETLPGYSRDKPRTTAEEVVVRIAGEVELPGGRHHLLLIPRNMVDGRMDKVYLGVEPLDGDRGMAWAAGCGAGRTAPARQLSPAVAPAG